MEAGANDPCPRTVWPASSDGPSGRTRDAVVSRPLMHIAAKRRSFMLLQGPAGPFFAQLGRELMRAGYATTRVNFCGGDRIFWPSRQRGDVLNFTGSIKEWPAFVRTEMRERAITDIVIFGDCRPIHRLAALAAEDLGATFWAFEEGYLRPDWITLEVGGTNGCSSLPREPVDILARSNLLSKTLQPLPISKGALPKLVVRQIAYEAASILLRPLFPAYRTHRPFSPLVEAWGWLIESAMASPSPTSCCRFSWMQITSFAPTRPTAASAKCCAMSSHPTQPMHRRTPTSSRRYTRSTTASPT